MRIRDESISSGRGRRVTAWWPGYFFVVVWLCLVFKRLCSSGARIKKRSTVIGIGGRSASPPGCRRRTNRLRIATTRRGIQQKNERIRTRKIDIRAAASSDCAITKQKKPRPHIRSAPTGRYAPMTAELDEDISLFSSTTPTPHQQNPPTQNNHSCVVV